MAGRQDPLVSIIVPVFNGERTLKESLDSILAQTYPRTEVLVMDDASNDRTPDIIVSYSDRVRSFRQPCNQGIYKNANDGILKARGEYVAVYHADDIYHPRIVEREVAFLEHYPQAGAVFCMDNFIDLAGRPTGRLELLAEVRGGRPLEYRVILNTMLKYTNCFLRCPTAMVRATVYWDVGLYRDVPFRNKADVEMWLRIAKKYPIGILEEYLHNYRHGHGSSAQRYHHLRTHTDGYFDILDLYLDEGGRALASPEALAAHEAYRARDRLMCAISNYVVGARELAQAMLDQVGAAQILASPHVQRARLLTLLWILQVVFRLPRIAFLANLFYRRWHAQKGEA